MQRKVLENTKEYQSLLSCIKNEENICVQGVHGTLKTHIIEKLYEDFSCPYIIITYNEIEARKIHESLEELNAHNLLVKDVSFFNAYAHSQDIRHKRTEVINSIIRSKNPIVVTSIENLFFRYIPKAIYQDFIIDIQVDDLIDIDDLSSKLAEAGYEKRSQVNEKGEFSVRGYIIDIFSLNNPYPIRIELFDDVIESIRYFNPEDQKSVEMIEYATVYPAREFIITDNERLSAIEKLSKYKGLEDITSLIESGIYREFLEKYYNFFFEKPYSFFDYFDHPKIILHEPKNIEDAATSFIKDFSEKYLYYLKSNTLDIKDYIYSYDDIYYLIKKYNYIAFTDFKKRIDIPVDEIVEIKSRESITYYGNIKELLVDLNRNLYSGYKILIAFSREDRIKKFKDLLLENGIHLSDEIQSSAVTLIHKDIKKGYELKTSKFILLTENEIFGIQKRKSRPKKIKDGKKIKAFTDLNIGDYIVHENYGIGKYIGIDKLTVDDVEKDYLKIKYRNDDFLYIPIDQMDLIQKYIGKEIKSVKLSKLNGKEWARSKSKAQKSIEDITDELLALYAKRSVQKGFMYSKDTKWQIEFEEMFPYEETEDQLKCIREIKEDMESDRPMDRLLCGDVGFGKTEVALRAVFKAVMDGKQVVFLVPTTILAQQHYNTMVSRFSKYPVSVEMLSRFRTKKQQDKIIEDLRTGVLDVVVGTHRVLNKNIVYKDLGLIVIDEEQRFGVKHKEKLKALKENIDVLTLTATPIPRTLHMSLVGIRDMSVIEDPPEDRYPIQTYVVESDDNLISEAIKIELNRSGQVYYVHNRVEDIDVVAEKIRNLVPRAKVISAHGQMSERMLENIMIDFMEHKFDVLVSTTIIETGLDISNANTIIIDDSDKMGLSQLYQLKGRIGRSNRLSYAYLLYQKNKVLTEIASKRLRAIRDFTELGAGFKIAMRDLEIRGGGNLLGKSQHGHISDIGYELYVEMLEREINRIKGIKQDIPKEITINFSVSAYIPDSYVEDENYKLELYKKISSIRGDADFNSIKKEMEDRYGRLPSSVVNLLNIGLIKAYCKILDMISASDRKKYAIFELESDTLDTELIGMIGKKYPNAVKFDFSKKPILKFLYTKTDLIKEKRFIEAKEFLKNIINLMKEENDEK